jgi:GMP synthase (glutamine-hydrolysing)
MAILLINSAERGIDEFCLPVEGILRDQSIEFRRIEYDEAQGFDRSGYRGFILSGSPCGDDIVAHHLPFFGWIKGMEKPVLGICAGHHIIGTLFGSTLVRKCQSEVGTFPVTVVADDPLFRGLSSEFEVEQAHHDAVTLPDGFVLLARSERCQNQVMRHRLHPVYSTQFHPEMLNPLIIINFLDIARAYSGGEINWIP